MAKWISTRELSPTLSIQTYSDGFWLYDSTRGMNLAMSCSTEEEAFVKAIHYYQRRLLEVEGNYSNLKSAVDAFVDQVVEQDE